MNNIRKFIYTVKENGSANYNIITRELNPKEGCLVPIKDRKSAIHYLTEGNIREYIDKNMSKLCLKFVYLCCRKTKAGYELDCLERFDDKVVAIEKAKVRGFWDRFDEGLYGDLIDTKNKH